MTKAEFDKLTTAEYNKLQKRFYYKLEFCRSQFYCLYRMEPNKTIERVRQWNTPISAINRYRDRQGYRYIQGYTRTTVN